MSDNRQSRQSSRPRCAVVLINLGTPESPEPTPIRRFLREFLSDRRVVEMHPIIWKPILEGFILPFRPRMIAPKYRSIWTDNGSPLKHWTQQQAQLLRERLGDQAEVHIAMRYGNPSIPSVLSALRQTGYDRVLILPAYPQYSASTVGTVFDEVARWILENRNQLDLRLIRNFHASGTYIDALAEAIETSWEVNGRPNFAAGERLIASYHSIPMKMHQQGDPYKAECEETSRLLRNALGLDEEHMITTYQSVFGRAEWIGPATIDTVESLGRSRAGRVDIICPGFMADCLETLEEINILNRETFLEAGGKDFHYIPWGNDSVGIIDTFEEVIRGAL